MQVKVSCVIGTRMSNIAALTTVRTSPKATNKIHENLYQFSAYGCIKMSDHDF